MSKWLVRYWADLNTSEDVSECNFRKKTVENLFPKLLVCQCSPQRVMRCGILLRMYSIRWKAKLRQPPRQIGSVRNYTKLRLTSIVNTAHIYTVASCSLKYWMDMYTVLIMPISSVQRMPIGEDVTIVENMNRVLPLWGCRREISLAPSGLDRHWPFGDVYTHTHKDITDAADFKKKKLLITTPLVMLSKDS